MNDYELIKTNAIARSGTNPRKRFNDGKMSELVESVRAHGILQPILVRPLPATTYVSKDLDAPKAAWRVWGGLPNYGPICLSEQLSKAKADSYREAIADARFVLVAGERRLRAAQTAGLEVIPCVVRQLNDKEALEIQVVENMQRDDIHPMEEAEGYESLIHAHGYTVDDLHVKMAKSKTYIYGRLKLLELCPDARAAFEEDKISASIALLLARIPRPELQAEALANMCFEHDDTPRPLSDVRRDIQMEFMLRLSDAPFDPTLPDLVPLAGPCGACPKRSGNQPDLFGDVAHQDTCTDPHCFGAKRQAWSMRLVEQAEAEGRQVMAPKEAFSQYGCLKDNLVSLADRCDALGWDHKHDWKKTLGKKCPPVSIAMDDEGNALEVLPRAQAVALLKELGKLKPSAQATAGADPYDAAQARLKRTKELHEAAALAAAPRILELILGIVLPAWIWQHLARAAYRETNIEAHAFAARRRGLAKKMTQVGPALDKWFKDTHESLEYAGMAAELLLCSRWTESWDHKFSPDYLALCTAAGVDLDKLTAELKAVNKAKSKGQTNGKTNGKTKPKRKA